MNKCEHSLHRNREHQRNLASHCCRSAGRAEPEVRPALQSWPNSQQPALHPADLYKEGRTYSDRSKSCSWVKKIRQFGMPRTVDSGEEASRQRLGLSNGCPYLVVSMQKNRTPYQYPLELQFRIPIFNKLRKPRSQLCRGLFFACEIMNTHIARFFEINTTCTPLNAQQFSNASSFCNFRISIWTFSTFAEFVIFAYIFLYGTINWFSDPIFRSIFFWSANRFCSAHVLEDFCTEKR